MRAGGRAGLFARPRPRCAPPTACSQHDVLTSALRKSPCGETGKKEKSRKLWTLGKFFYSGSIQRGPCKEPGGIVALPGARADPKPGPCMVGYLGYLM